MGSPASCGVFFFFSSRRRHTRCSRDWSSDVCSSDLFEPLTFEDVLEIVRWERPKGVVVQLGGQTPLRLTKPLEAAGVTILGTPPDSIDVAEDRERFEALARRLGIPQPPNGTARSVEEAVQVAERI